MSQVSRIRELIPSNDTLLQIVSRSGCVEFRPQHRIAYAIGPVCLEHACETIEHARKCSLLVETEDIRKLRTWKAQLYLIIHDMDIPNHERNLAAYVLEKKINDTLRD